MKTHREAVRDLLLASPEMRQQIAENTGVEITDANWPRIVDIFIDFVGLYDGDKLRPDWRERLKNGGAPDA